MRVQVNGIQLFFDVEGPQLVPDGATMRERPVLLLLHGGPGMDGSYWRPAFSALADVAQVVYLDQRGCGRSDRGDPRDWTLAQWGDDVRALCDVLGLERPIVCGSSFGGEVALSYVTRHPGHAGKLILLSCGARLDIPRIREAFRRRGGDRAATIAEAFWSDFDLARAGDYMTHCIPLYFRTPQDPQRDARAITNGDLTVAYLTPGGEAHRADFREDLVRITCPTLVMGGEDDPVVPIEDMAEMAAAIPDARLERIPDCGHGPFFDRPEHTLRVIREFILSDGS